MRSPIDCLVDWDAVGRQTLAQIPESERNVFVNWISDDPTILKLYEDTLGEGVVPLWFVSLARTQMKDQQLPEGF